MSEKINFPTKLEEKLSFFDRLRKLMKKTSVTVDSNGKVSYISYPPRNGFSDKQKENIETIEVNDILILGDNRDRSLLELKKLKTLVLGRGIVGVTDGAIPNTGLEELVLSDQARQIPEGIIYNSSIKRVRGNEFDISTDAKALTSIYFDIDGRLHFKQSETLSLAQCDELEKRGKSPAKESENYMYSLAERLIKNSSQNSNANSIFVYSEDIGRERKSSIHAVVDKYPIPSGRSEKIDDDKLIGIYITGVEEVDLANLLHYPNLKYITVGKDVRRVTTTQDFSEKGIDSKSIQRTQKNTAGKEQFVTMMSETTNMMMPLFKQTMPQVRGKVKSPEQEPTLDD